MKRSGKWQKGIAVLMSVCMLMCVVPAEALEASGESAGTANAGAEVGAEASSVGSVAVVLRELSELREENVKHFQMSDGTVQAVSYDTAVHYRKDGVWEEIDNRLSADQSDGVRGYANAENDVQIKLAESSDGAYLMKLSKEGKSLSFRAAANGRGEAEQEAAAGNAAAADSGIAAGDSGLSQEDSGSVEPEAAQTTSLKIYDPESGR